MPDINDQPWAEGDAFTAATINDRFSHIEAVVNEIPRNGIQRNALRSEHLPSALGVYGGSVAADYFKSGTAAITNFINTHPGHGANTYGGVGGGVAGVNWRGLAVAAQVTFPAHRLGMSQAPRVAGFLVRANLELRACYDTGFPTASLGPNYAVVSTIMWQDSGGTWYNIDRAERTWDLHMDNVGSSAFGAASTYNALVRMDLPLMTYICETDVGSSSIQAIQQVLCVYDRFGGGAAMRADVQRYSILALPLHAG